MFDKKKEKQKNKLKAQTARKVKSDDTFTSVMRRNKQEEAANLCRNFYSNNVFSIFFSIWLSGRKPRRALEDGAEGWRNDGMFYSWLSMCNDDDS